MSGTQRPQGGKIESLPNEILTEILLHGAELILPPSSPDMVPFATIASHVCHLWRELALVTPDLWTTIRISADRASLHAANLYVARARDRLLDITITLPENDSTQAVGTDMAAVHHFDLALSILGPHLARWRTLVLHVGWTEREQLSGFLFSANPAELMHLTYLHLGEGMEVLPPQVYPPSPPAFPRLRGIRLQDARPLEFQLDKGMELLHTLDINATNIIGERYIFKNAVAAMPHLATLVLREFPCEIPTQTLKIRTLRSLAVQFVRFAPESLETLTTWVKATNLEYLELANISLEPVSEDRTCVKVPSVWEEPQFPCLRTLRLVDTKLTPRKVALLEMLCPDITTLELVNVSGTETLYVEPSRREDHPPWPSLRTLRADSATFGPWVERFTARGSLLGPDRGLTSLALAPDPERDELSVNLTAILDRAPFSTCGMLEGFTRPFFEDGSDFQITRAH
ncbi:hypothetical protein C8R46DRAFT_1218776 [Mycena filopes]|nr:hypothetical protein C8R46DRAFT_1218776 [Mycena filopes]